MKQNKNMNIEVEGGEIILRNAHSDYVIIPKKYRTEVQDMIKEGCHGCIDKLVDTLPVMEDYAEDGSLLPDWDKVKSTLNPYNWGVPDYSDKGDFGTAYSAARKAGEKEFMWNNKRYSTNYKGTPQQQLKETGITNEQLQGKSELRDRIYYKDYETGRKQMYYSDKELLELDPNKKNFDTLALQRELSNRGYKLPKSTKKDGTLDGIFGDETKNALLDYQMKNKLLYTDANIADIAFENKPYTTVQDNTYVAPKVIIPLEQKKKQQFIPREQPVLKADTRTDQERKIAQEYAEAVLNPSIATQIGEAFQKPLRWLADPVKGIGDIISAVAPNSALAKDLPNTNEETFEHRKKQLNPYTSNKEKINNTINEAMPLTNWALLNTLPIEAATGNMIKSSKNLIKPVSKVVNKTDDVIKLYHYTNSPLKFKDIDVLRVGESQMKKRYLKLPIEDRPAGFYTNPDKYASFMGGKQGYELHLPKDIRIKDMASEGYITDRIAQKDLKKLIDEGYDVIKGKNMIGKEEWILLNKDKVKSFNYIGERYTRKDLADLFPDKDVMNMTTSELDNLVFSITKSK